MSALIQKGSRTSAAQPSLATRIGGSVFFTIFLALGVTFLFLIAREAYRTLQTWHWLTVPCVIDSSKVLSRPNDYQFQIAYRYQVAAKTYHSTRFAGSSSSSSDYASQQRLVMQYPSGAATFCFVNPADPSESLMRLGNLWILLFTLIPLIFVALGGGGLYATWFRTPSLNAPAALARRRARKNNPATGFGLFAVIGGVMFCIMSVRVMVDMSSARNWIATPCVIKSSRVQYHSGKGTTYGIDILYAYIENGREYCSNRYGFMSGSTSGYAGKAAVVKVFSRGRHTVCFVNPDDPTDAVLNRGFTSDMLFGLIPLLFLVVGLVGLIVQLRKRRLRST